MDLFVYGTLRSPALMAAVAGPGDYHASPAILPGYRVAPMDGQVVPMIIADAAAQAEGLIWHGLSGAQMARLNLYEGAFGYDLIDVRMADGSAAKMYLAATNARPGAGPWSLTDWKSRHEGPGVLAATEIFAVVPPMSAPELVRQFPTIEKRAWAVWRAQNRRGPATVRHAPQPGDFHITNKGPATGSFFRLQPFKVTHRRFDGAEEGPLRREVFMGVDAALVLPYDVARDRILLVEQARMGPGILGDPNPWTLEPVAGMIDARETPQDAAIRETFEETGLTLQKLIAMPAFYPSPGSSTDYFLAYLGLCDLPDSAHWSGGLATEAEDLRMHPMSFDDAMALVDSGEITAGPLIMMLYWLALRRAALLDVRPVPQ